MQGENVFTLLKKKTKMKTLILLLLFVFGATQIQAQEMMKKDIPVAVMTTFGKTHPLARSVGWSKDGKNFEAKYYSGKRHKYVTYDSAGILVETEIKIAPSNLPAPAVEYVKTYHKDHKIKEASKMIDAMGVVTYEAEVHEMYLIFDHKGGFIRSEKK